VVAADRRPSYEELAVENGELRALVERLAARLHALESENAELRTSDETTATPHHRGTVVNTAADDSPAGSE
jgi:anti-sigma-K factor RskA